MDTISVKELKEKLKNMSEDEIVVDVRTQAEFSEVRIDDPKVINIELSTVIHNAEALEGKKAYLICNS
ncbi:MAG: rhodanese-like domain-containing protein [Candidatus Dojkabacteria bacterium]|nr:rhodanese-like domain-containing protein [Candidatus Dojkabacteria bacterium]MDQ7020916.1 rhodanese-like domain-containing protein [Candidatus Dojkabacteria bacterium]